MLASLAKCKIRIDGEICCVKAGVFQYSNASKGMSNVKQSHKVSRITILGILMLAMGLTGCVGRMVGATVGGTWRGDVTVRSFARSADGLLSQTYCLFPADPAISESDLVFGDLLSKAKVALNHKGFSEAASLEQCQQAIFVSIEYGAPQSQLSDSLRRFDSGSVVTSATSVPKSAGRWLSLVSANYKEYITSGEQIELWRVVATLRETRAIRVEDLHKSATTMLAASVDQILQHNPEGRVVRVRTRSDNFELLTENLNH